MITTVTLNPMLDKTVHVGSLGKGKIHRALKLEMVVGGKGINVARQLNRFGIKTLATGFLGGEIGSMIMRLLDSEGIDHDFVETGVMTREGMTYLESDGTSTAVFEPAGRIPVHCVHHLNKKLAELSTKSTWIVCSGSSPGLEADNVYYEAILSAHKAGIRSVLDSYGEALKFGLRALPTLIKPNRHEYQQTFGRSLTTESKVQKTMDEWLEAGIKYVVITDGANPAYAASSDDQWKIEGPPVTSTNPVGSGDAMIAGIVYGFEQGWTFDRCVAFGTAAGAANARKWEVAQSTFDEVSGLEDQVKITKIL